MINKVYSKTKTYIKENYKGILIILTCFLLVTVRLPYYIECPGGLLDTVNKIDYKSTFKMKGTLNMAYVSQVDGTAPMLLYAFINPNWDIIKEKDLTADNESIEDQQYRNKLLLEEANDTSLLLAFQHSNIKYTITKSETFVTYVDKLAQTDLKIGDKIISVNNHQIKRKQDLYNYIAKEKIGSKVIFKVIRNNKEKECSAKLINVENEPKVGIIITEDVDIKSGHNIDFKFKSSESGSSGGLMMTLTIYSFLNKKDLTAGKKIAGTGTIDNKGNVGEISGIKYKLIGAVKKKADVFLVPYGDNYKEAIKIKKQKNYKIKIIPVKTLKEAITYLS